MNTNHIVYDLRVLPPTFDFLGFVVVARTLQLAQNNFASESALNLTVINPCQGELLRPKEFSTEDTLSIVSERIYGLILPVCRLLPYLKDVEVVSSNNIGKCGLNFYDNVLFPLGYNPNNPALYRYYKGHMLLEAAKSRDIRDIVVPEEAKKKARAYLGSMGLKPGAFVLVALRTNSDSLDRSRDTNAEWLRQLTIALQAEGIPMLILADRLESYMIETLVSDTPHAVIDNALSMDPVFRAAAYETAAFCIFGASGNSSVGYLNRNTKFAYTGMTVGKTFTDEWHIRQGWKRNFNHFSPDSDSQFFYWDYPPVGSLLNIISANLILGGLKN